ncbi:excinuclease ABC subunit C [Candidatus Azobacteroides pseudotrichonymphae genomovar. CFP2]|uniref:UvrABC system protein C n=2 Tax=Candidatus Azobacteroides TaxID=511434 RepID=B6YRI2_AZOPC|nr:excinuclease ABC subunit UvrC [Candidatus Azobacteroides pseudotrichonymphae]BAG83804.1 excinuclease ABC subunit C [Candidatus Azobacteroides pseudotrichonymphae genomovar. CFP2]
MKKTYKNDLSLIISALPECSGVYMYSDENGIIIYIGKAKNLKKRVSSYFKKTTHDNLKTKILVQKVRNIDYLVVESGEDALLLENNLIKKYQPKYNILLKDDKTYPWIAIKNESFPRIQLSRRKVKNNSRYYGPYTSVSNVKCLLQLICSLYPIRTCKYVLSQVNIKRKKFHVCLQYHIKKCLGPCIGMQTEKEYDENIRLSEKILKGKYREVSRLLYQKMINLAAEMQFEKAEIVRKQYVMLKDYSSKSIVVSQSLNNVDVYSFDENAKSAYINYLHIIDGAIVNGYTIEYKKKLDESKETILAMGITELRLRFKSKAKEIIVPFYPEIEIDNLIFTIPKRGEKKKLLCLSEKNVKQYKLDQLNKADKLNSEQRSIRILKILQNELHLKKLPLHIECFDNSNIQGVYPVSSCVVFKKANPSKKDYRHFNIKTVNGPNDFRSMYETVLRRYNRLIEENQPLPDLIVIDGGKGQLHASVDALKEIGLYEQIPIIAIAKRLEEIYFPNDPLPLYLDKNSEGLKLIQYLRDEAHRFGINFHRNQRSRNQLISKLDSIKGIGVVTKEKLLRKYKSTKQIKEDVSQEEIISLIGKKKAERLLNHLSL